VDDQGEVTKRMFKVGRDKVLAEGEEDVLIPKVEREERSYTAVRVLTCLDHEDEPSKDEPPEEPVEKAVVSLVPLTQALEVLEAEERHRKKKKKKKKNRHHDDDDDDDDDHDSRRVHDDDVPSFDMSRVEQLVKEIRESVEEIETQTFNLTSESSLSEYDFDGIVEDLTGILADCKAAKYAASKGGAF